MVLPLKSVSTTKCLKKPAPRMPSMRRGLFLSEARMATRRGAYVAPAKSKAGPSKTSACSSPTMPAMVVLGLWMVLQLFSGVGSIATTSSTTETGGVAYAAHVGGFITGLVLTLLFRPRNSPQAS